MKLVLVGFSHKNAPMKLRERLALLPARGVYEGLLREGCAEAVVLSTCNRFELYMPANGDAEQRAAAALSLLEGLSGIPLASHVCVHEGERAVRHLFEVASGLDSLVVGETEILGQVKTAYESAKAAGMTGKYSNVLFQRALHVGKRVRSDTAIAVGQTSVASVAVQLAESIFGGLGESSVLILGAGNMAELTARHLLSKKVARLLIANRTWERAKALAERFEALPLAWERFPEALSHADILIASTGSERPVLTREMVASAMRGRGGRSLFLIDIAMPRDVEEEVHGLDHVYLYRLEDLETIVAENLKSRGSEVERARQLVLEKAEEFCSWERSVESGREISLRHRLTPEREAAG